MLRDAVRGVCNEQSPIAVVRAIGDDPIGYSAAFWKKLAELELLGLILPERRPA